MTWQFNPERGDITDPAVPQAESSISNPETYAYYGGDLICETVRSTHGPLLANSQAMLALLKDGLTVNGCEPIHPNGTCSDCDWVREVQATIEKIEPKKGRLFGPCDPQGPAGPEAFNHDDCAYFNDLSGETCSCDCHTPSDIKFKLQRLRVRGIILSPELEERLRP